MTESRSQYQVYTDVDGERRWRLRAANGEIVAVSADGFSDDRDVRRAIQTHRAVAATASIHDVDIQETE